MQDLQKIVSALPRLHLLHSREHAAPLQLNLKHQSASGPLSAATLTQCAALSSTAEDAAVLSLTIAKSKYARLGLVSLSSSALHEGTPSMSDLLPALTTPLSGDAKSLTPCWCTEAYPWFDQTTLANAYCDLDTIANALRGSLCNCHTPCTCAAQ